MKIPFLALWMYLSFMGIGAECKRDKKDERILRSSAFIDRVKGIEGSGALRKYHNDKDEVVRPPFNRFLKKSKDKKTKKEKPIKGRSRKKSADKLIKSGKKSKSNEYCLDLLPGPILDIFQQITASSIPGESKTSIPNTVPPTRSGKKASPVQESVPYDGSFDQMCCLASGLRGTLGFDWSDLLTGFAASNGVCPSTWDGGEFEPDMTIPQAAFDTSISSIMENDDFRIMNEMIVETMPLAQSEFYIALDDLLSLVSDDLDAVIVMGDEVSKDHEIQFVEPFLSILKCWVDPPAVDDGDYGMCAFLLELPGIAFVFAVTPYILPACDCHYTQDLNCATQTCQPTHVSDEVLVSTLDEAVNNIVENESLLNNDDDKNSTAFLDTGYDEWSNDGGNLGETDTKDYKEWSNDGNDYNNVGGKNNSSNEYEDWSNDSSVFRSHLDGGGDRKTKSLEDEKDPPRRSLDFENVVQEGLTHVGMELFGLLMSCSTQEETCRGYCALHSNPSISVSEICSIVQNSLN